MKFRVNTEDLITALACVSIVPPRAVTASGGAGYLFVVQDETKCSLYSRDNMCVAKADFPISDLERSEGDSGSFVYPSGYTDAFKFVGDSLTLESIQEEEKFTVKYEASSGAAGERASFDPVLLSTCDKDLEEAGDPVEFPVGLLKEALSTVRPFMSQPKDKAEEQTKGILLFDTSKPEWANGDGTLFSTNSTQMCYFESEAFKGKGLEISGLHLPPFLTFLAKSSGVISIRRGNNFIFATNSHGHSLGWPKHNKNFGKYAYWSLDRDNFVLAMPKARVLEALRYTRLELDSKSDKIKVIYSADKKELLFGVAEGKVKAQSFPIQVVDKSKVPPVEGFSINANIDHLISLIDGVKAPEVELRLTITAPNPAKGRLKGAATIRTIDEVQMTAEGKVVVETEGTFKCKITRFVPSKD